MNVQIAPCLWFETQAEDAAKFYTAVFPGSRIGRISRYGKEGFEIHGRPAGGDRNAQQCGGLKDKFGLSWQVVPRVLPELMSGPDKVGSQRTMKALLQMKRLDIAALKRAHAG